MRSGAAHIVDPLAFHGTAVFRWLESARCGNGYYVTVPLAVKLPKKLGRVECCVENAFRIEGGMLYVHRFMWFDGASGPAIDGVTNILAALVHDCLYAAMTERPAGLSYAKADSLYREICIAQRAGSLRAWGHYLALRAFGWIWRMNTGSDRSAGPRRFGRRNRKRRLV